MDPNKAFITQTFNNGRPHKVYSYQELPHARARATLHAGKASAPYAARGVKIFEANFDTLTLTQVDERGTVVPTDPGPGHPTLF